MSAVVNEDAFLLMDNALPDEELKYSLEKVGQYHDRYGAPTIKNCYQGFVVVDFPGNNK